MPFLFFKGAGTALRGGVRGFRRRYREALNTAVHNISAVNYQLTSTDVRRDRGTSSDIVGLAW